MRFFPFFDALASFAARASRPAAKFRRGRPVHCKVPARPFRPVQGLPKPSARGPRPKSSALFAPFGRRTEQPVQSARRYRRIFASVRMPSASASASAFTSSGVLSAQNETRSAVSMRRRARPMAVSVWLASPRLHAEPLETQMPLLSKKCSIVSLLMPSTEKFASSGRASGGLLRVMPGSSASLCHSSAFSAAMCASRAAASAPMRSAAFASAAI